MFFKRLREDIDAYLARDPAARSRLEVVLCYSGFHVMLFHRLAHLAWRHGWRLGARVISQFAKLLTGIEIHPGARIGRRFVIDHGAAVVIGETAEIGDDVTLYQGVTLGGISPAVDSRSQVERKRHPTLEDEVIVGSGAQLLGPIRIGRGARVGANAVVTRDLAPSVTAVGIPARVVMPKDRQKAREFLAYGTPTDGGPDPLLQTIEHLRHEVTTLSERLAEVEARLAGRDAEGAGDERPARREGGARPAVVLRGKS